MYIIMKSDTRKIVQSWSYLEQSSANTAFVRQVAKELPGGLDEHVVLCTPPMFGGEDTILTGGELLSIALDAESSEAGKKLQSLVDKVGGDRWENIRRRYRLSITSTY